MRQCHGSGRRGNAVTDVTMRREGRPGIYAQPQSVAYPTLLPRGREEAEARIFAATCFEMRFAVNPAPYAKRVNGPNELAEASPTIYRPGTDVSKWLERTGVSSTSRSWRRKASSRNPIREIEI